MNEPVVVIPAEIAEKMRLYCLIETENKEAGDEIYGLLLIDEIEGGFEVVDIIMPEQEVSSSSVDFDLEKLGAFVSSLPKKKLNKCRGWFHSHGSMSAFWSSTDEENIDDYLNGGDYLVSIVAGKDASEFRIRVDERGIKSKAICTWDEIKMTMSSKTMSKNIDLITKEIEKKVTKKVYKSIYFPARSPQSCFGSMTERERDLEKKMQCKTHGWEEEV